MTAIPSDRASGFQCAVLEACPAGKAEVCIPRAQRSYPVYAASPFEKSRRSCRHGEGRLGPPRIAP
jgi:hypothetical protein